METDSLHGAITLHVIGDFDEARAELEGVDGLVELKLEQKIIVVRLVPFTPAETAAKRWLRGGDEISQGAGSPWRRQR